MWFWNGHMGWGGMLAMWLAFIVIVALAGWIGVSVTRHRGTPPGEESAEQILKRRYAKGEIDRATYERMLEDLRK